MSGETIGDAIKIFVNDYKISEPEWRRLLYAEAYLMAYEYKEIVEELDKINKKEVMKNDFI